MAQLSDDCFAHGDRPLRVAEALALIRAEVRPVGEVERAALDDALGRVLAAPLTAPFPLPPAANSAVDGYAVRHADLAPDGPTRLPVRGRLAAGDAATAPLPPGAAARVFTGAPMPPGADTVFMQEDVRVEASGAEGDRALLPPGLKRGANARAAGEDVERGAEALPAGRRLRAQDLALAAALGATRLPVRRRLVVAVLSTGAELAAPGAPLSPGQVHDANGPMLAALARAAGALAAPARRLPDDAAATARALAEAAAVSDLVVTSGGVSLGEEDHVRAAVGAAGRLVHWRLAVKPGRPVAVGVVGGAPVVGLPGNPAAAFVTFALVVRPLLAALAGEAWSPPLPTPVRAGFAARKKPARREYVRCRLSPGEDGRPVAHRHPREGAGVLTSLTDTDGLVELAEDATGVAEGEWVGFLPYAALL